MFDAGVDPPTVVHVVSHLHSRDNLVFDIVGNIFFIKYYTLASAVILYFDHLVTLKAEIEIIWNSQFTTATILFLLNRYIPFFGFIPILISLFNPPWNIQLGMRFIHVQRCLRFGPFIGALSVTTNSIAAIILIIRTYALYARATWVLVLTSVVAGASIAISSWSASTVKGELFSFQPIVACLPDFLGNNNSFRVAWILTLSFDALIFLLTISRSYRFVRAHASLQIQSGLATLVMRDGSMYFLVMSIVNVVNYIASAKSSNSFFAQATGTSSILAQVISVTLISRLMLNLRAEGNLQRSGGRRSRSTSSAFDSQGNPYDSALTDTRLIFTTRIFSALTDELGSADPYTGYLTRHSTRRSIGTMRRGEWRRRVNRGGSRGSSFIWTDDEYLSADASTGDLEEQADTWGEEGESYELQNRSPSTGAVSPSTTFAASSSSKSASGSGGKPLSDTRSSFGIAVNTASASASGSGTMSGTSSSVTRSRGSSHRRTRSRGDGYRSGQEQWNEHDSPLTPATTLIGSDAPLSARPLLHSPTTRSQRSTSPSPLSALSGDRPGQTYPPFSSAYPQTSQAQNHSRRHSHSRSYSNVRGRGRGRGLGSETELEPGSDDQNGPRQHARHRSADNSHLRGFYSQTQGRDVEQAHDANLNLDVHLEGNNEVLGDVGAQGGPLHTSITETSVPAVGSVSRERQPSPPEYSG